MPEDDTRPDLTEMPEDDPRPDLTEVIKLGFEIQKHLTTLNAGSIVVIGTFLSDIFPTDKQGALTVPSYIKCFIAIAFVGFGISLIFAAVAMFLIRGHFIYYLQAMAHTEERGGRPGAGRGSIIMVLLPLGSFTLGLIFFGLAVVLNLFFGS